MNNKHFIYAAIALFTITTLAWFGLAYQQWSTVVAVITSVPLITVLVILYGRKPKTYFYAALVLMAYIATTITQIMVAPGKSALAIVCLASALLYLILLKFTLRALNAT